MDSLGRSGVNFFKDKRVRQAANHAIDKDEIIQTVLKGYAKVTNSAANSLHYGYEPNVTAYPYDRRRPRSFWPTPASPTGSRWTITPTATRASPRRSRAT